MADYRYLVIGSGMTADSAVRGIRELDPDGSIGMIGLEPDPPYDRPPLTKGLWKDKPFESIWRSTEARGARLLLGRRVVKLDLASKHAADDRGEIHAFEKVLLATGGTPRRLPFGVDHIIYFRTLDDYRRLRAIADRGESFAVIGGGFIGSEIAAALSMNGKKVAMIFPERTVCSRVFPEGLARFVSDYYAQKGVELVPEETAVSVEPRGERVALRIQSQREFVVDGIVAGIGMTPNVELAETAGLPVRNGIAVDESLRAGHPDVFAAGDVAEFYNPALGMRRRVEHEDNANTMGKAAGRAMAGDPAPYHHLPYFYSDLFELGYEAVGELDSRLETFEDWQEPHRKGVVYYLRDGRVRGVLLWNVWEQVEAGRRLIAEAGRHRPEDLRGRLPEAR